MKNIYELDHSGWLKRLVEIGTAAVGIMTGIGYIAFYVIGISSSADRANAKAAELEGRIDRQKDAIVEQRKVLEEVNQRTARIEGMVQILVRHKDEQ